VVQQADVVRDGPGGVDVVRDDEERRVSLLVEIDDELVEIRRADRVEPGVRLVEEDDLGVEDEGARESGALAHAARDLAWLLLLRADQPDHLKLLVDD